MRAARYFLIVAAALLFFAPHSAQARNHGGGAVALTSCPFTGDPNDGCNTSPGGTVQNAGYFTNGRQSGQAAYPARPNRNLGGVDYPNGAYTPDGGLTDIKTATAAGCSGYDIGSNTFVCHSTKATATASIAGNTLTVGTLLSGSIAAGQTLNFFCDPAVNAFCATHPKILSGAGTTWLTNGPAITVASQTVNFVIDPVLRHIRLNDVLYNDDGLGNNTFEDLHVTTGLNTCRYMGQENMIAGFGDLSAHSITFDYDPICSPIAFFYLQTGDPGLPTEGSGNLSIANGVMTISGYSGTFAVGMVIHYTGQSGALMAWTTSDSGFFNCAGAGCNGHTANLTIAPCGEFTPTCALDSSLNVTGPVAFTAGPIQENTGREIAGGGGWATLSFLYNNLQGGIAFLKSSTGGPLDARFNYCDQVFYPDVHGECFSVQQTPGAATVTPYSHQNYNVALSEKWSRGGQGTAPFTFFANGPGIGYQISTTDVQLENNTSISNVSINPAGLQTNGYNFRTLNQTVSPNGIIVNLNISGNWGDDVSGAGAFGQCNRDPNISYTGTTTTINNVNLTTGTSSGFSC